MFVNESECEMCNLDKGPSIDASYQFHFIWQSGLIEAILEINQSKTRIAYGGYVCQRTGTKWAILIEDFP